MKRLRHPIRAVREPFGKAGLIVACLALVFAMAGGAFAAKGALTGKQKKEVAKIAKKIAKKEAKKAVGASTSKAGPAGPVGPAGPAGAAGKAGSNGANGEKGERGETGERGEPGEPGEPGESPVGTAFTGAEETPANEGECEGAGGVVYETATEEQVVCNGKEGSPWTAGGVLPSGQEETGTWAFSANAADEPEGAIAPISFTIQLPESLAAGNIFYSGKTGFSEHCAGNVAIPQVKSTTYTGDVEHATLCVFEGAVEHATFEAMWQSSFAAKGASVVGGVLLFEGVTGAAHGVGAWAVKAK